MCFTALENKLMSNASNHVEVKDDKQHQGGQYMAIVISCVAA